MTVHSRYTDGSYYLNNPSWDAEHIPSKLSCFSSLCTSIDGFHSVIEVGCGSGLFIHALAEQNPNLNFIAYDPSPFLDAIWKELPSLNNLQFHNVSFTPTPTPNRVLFLLIDILEHIPDPISFLQSLAQSYPNCSIVTLIPLELSLASLMMPRSLIHSYKKVGHIHFFSSTSARILLSEAGFSTVSSILVSRYRFSSPIGFASRISFLARSIVHKVLGPEFLSRLFGGISIMAYLEPS